MLFPQHSKFLWKIGYLQFLWQSSLVCVHVIMDIWWWHTFFFMLNFWQWFDYLTHKYYLFVIFESSPSLDVDYDGVFGSPSSSTGVLSFCLTNVYWFASYFKIGNLYLSSFGSLSFFGHFLCEVSTNVYWSTMFVPNIYSAHSQNKEPRVHF